MISIRNPGNEAMVTTVVIAHVQSAVTDTPIDLKPNVKSQTIAGCTAHTWLVIVRVCLFACAPYR